MTLRNLNQVPETSFLPYGSIVEVDGANYIAISAIEDLEQIKSNLDGDYVLLNCLDFNSPRSYRNAGNVSKYKETLFTPIGDTANPFTGVFNGNGYIINNLIMETETADNFGLFGYNAGNISSVGVIGQVVNVFGIGGLLCGENNGVIEKCFSGGDIISVIAGGLVGDNLAGGTIQNCHSYANADSLNVGAGLCGSNANIIDYCFSSGSVMVAEGTDIGGLVAVNTGTVSNGFYDSETSGQTDTGKGDPLPTATAKDFTTYNAFDFEDVWIIANGESYPILQWQNEVFVNDLAKSIL